MKKRFNLPWFMIPTILTLAWPTMLEQLIQYMNEKKIKLDIVYFAERLRFYTAGYPFLVSKLFKLN